MIEKSDLVRVDKNKNVNELVFEDGFKLQTEALLLFPNLRIADTDFMELSDKDFEFDSQGRVLVDFS